MNGDPVRYRLRNIITRSAVESEVLLEGRDFNMGAIEVYGGMFERFWVWVFGIHGLCFCLAEARALAGCIYLCHVNKVLHPGWLF